MSILKYMVFFAGLVFCIFTAATVPILAQEVIPLYSGTIPNSLPGRNEEISDANHTEAANVSIPTLSIFSPPKEKANGAAVIICPGGGYGMLVMDREGTQVAKAFNSMGITAFVLKYRLPGDKTMKDQSIGPLQDAQQAIKVVRQRADEYRIHPQKIGIIGFSAGGHLAATAGTHFDQIMIDNKEGLSLRPDFMILVYPVISFHDTLTHKGSRNNLLGPSPTEGQVEWFSNELQVTSHTPPAFLVHAGDDSGVPVGNSIRFYEALIKNAVPAELHIYFKGEHGFLRYPSPEEWMGRCQYWMKNNHWID